MNNKDWKPTFAFTSTHRIGQTTVVGNELEKSKADIVINYIVNNIDGKVKELKSGDKTIYLDVDAFRNTNFTCQTGCDNADWRTCCVKTVKNGWEQEEIDFINERISNLNLRAECAEHYKIHKTYLTKILKKPKVINGWCFFATSINWKRMCAIKEKYSLHPLVCNLFPSEVIYLNRDKTEIFLTCVNKNNHESLTRHGASNRMFSQKCLAESDTLGYTSEKKFLVYLLGNKAYLDGLKLINQDT